MISPPSNSDPAATAAASRRVLIPTQLPRDLPLGGGAPARAIWTLSGETMGTHWRARIVSRPQDQSRHLEEVRSLLETTFERVVALMSPWEPTSDLGLYANLAPGETLSLSPETTTVLQHALDIARLTACAYHPAFGTVTDLLGFGPSPYRQAHLPDHPRVRDAFATVARAELGFDPEHRSITQPGGVQLDLCSIAKGYAIDLASDQLHAAGWTHHFIEIGGDARGRGIKPDGHPWWCALEVPAATPPTLAALCDLAIATSGNTHRHLQHANTRVGHLVRSPDLPDDPFEGSVTVLTPSAMTADAWATALHVLGPRSGAKIAVQHHLAAAWFSSDAEITTPAFTALLN